MFKMTLTLTNGHEITHKVSEEEEALEVYFDIQRAMQAAAQNQPPEVLALGESLLVRADTIMCCEIKGPRTQ